MENAKEQTSDPGDYKQRQKRKDQRYRRRSMSTWGDRCGLNYDSTLTKHIYKVMWNRSGEKSFFFPLKSTKNFSRN